MPGYLTPLNSNDLTSLSVSNPPGTTAPAGQVLGGSSNIDGTGRSDVQHLYYTGQDRHIYELAWSSTQGWKWYPLTVMTETQGYLSDSRPHCFYSVTDAGGGAVEKKQHVIYRSSGRLQELAWLGIWEHQRISDWANAPDAVGNPWGFSATPHRDVYQCVLYRGTDNHIHALEWRQSDSVWRHRDLTGDAVIAAASDPTGFAEYVSGCIYVFYRGVDNSIRGILWSVDDPRRRIINLSASSSAPLTATGRPFGLSDYSSQSGSLRHVFYVNQTNTVCHLKETNRATDAWVVEEIALGAPVNSAADPFAYLDGSGLSSLLHVFYLGNDQHIHELAWNPSHPWEPHDWNSQARIPTTLSASAPFGHIGGVDGASLQHVFFVSTAGRIIEIYQDYVDIPSNRL